MRVGKFLFILVFAGSQSLEAACPRLLSWLGLHLTPGTRVVSLDEDFRSPLGVIDVVAAAIYRDGRHLMGLRGAAPLKGLYGQLGGKRERGESLAQTLRRELREEIGLEVDDLSLALVTTSYLKENGNRYRIFVIEVGRILNEPSILELDKILSLRWFLPDEIPAQVTSASLDYLRLRGVLPKP